MMKRIWCLLFLVSASQGWGDNLTSTRVVATGATKAVVFEETLSPDKGYAIGWTLVPKSAQAPPVDWSKWNPDDAFGFMTPYPNDALGTTVAGQPQYDLVDGVIDFKGGKFLDLPTDTPDFPHKNRGFLVAAWVPLPGGTHYALVQNDARFATTNLWLITIDSAGMRQVDIARDLDQALVPLLEQKRPVGYADYNTFLSLSDSQTPANGVSFHEGEATFSFSSDIDKSQMETSEVDGKITVRLADGKVMSMSSATAVDDPFASNPDLAKADRELNAVYVALQKSLGTADREALKKEQVDWIAQRDEAAVAAMRNPPDDFADNIPGGFVRVLLTQTQDRTAELKKRMR